MTGGYGGLGFELSQILFAHNATVYVAGRSRPKTSEAIEGIKSAFPKSSGRLEAMEIDLSDQSTIKPAVQAFLAREKRLDVLVNNTGVSVALHNPRRYHSNISTNAYTGDTKIMWPSQGSKDAHGNELQIGTNCLGPYLLHKLLQPILSQTAATSPQDSVRVLWAASTAVDVLSPKPDGMELDEHDADRPRDLGVKLNYGQSKVGNVFLARHYAATATRQTGVVHASFNPGNLKTGLQRTWGGLVPKLMVSVNASLLAYRPFRPFSYSLFWFREGGIRALIDLVESVRAVAANLWRLHRALGSFVPGAELGS